MITEGKVEINFLNHIKMNELNFLGLVLGAIMSVILTELWSYIKIKYTEKQPIKRLSKMKAIKVLVFIFSYIYPFAIILYGTFFINIEPTFRTISLLIIVYCILFYHLIFIKILKINKTIINLLNINKTSITQTKKILEDLNSDVVKQIESNKKQNK